MAPCKNVSPPCPPILWQRIFRSSTIRKPGQENLLYVNYCYYAWNDAEDDFFANYFDDIMQARRKWEVIQYAEEKEGAAKL